MIPHSAPEIQAYLLRRRTKRRGLRGLLDIVVIGAAS